MHSVFRNLVIAIALLLTLTGCATSHPLNQLVHSRAQSPVVEGCPGQMVTVHGTTEQSVENSLQKEIIGYRTMAERALALRAETIKVGQRIKEKLDQGRPLSGADLAVLGEGVKAHLALRQELLAVAEAHECWLGASEETLAALGIDRKTRLKGVAMSLSAALLLYDNYLLSVSLFEGDPKIRRILNEKDPGYAVRSAELSGVTQNYNSIDNRTRVRKAMKFYEEESAKLGHLLVQDPDTAYLALLIEQSPSYSMVRKWSPFYVVGRYLGFFGAVTADTLAGFEREGMNLFSMVFGNAVGLVETRKGKLHGREDVLSDLQRTLKAGDILLEKTPFRLTDKLIPGYWGHAAVWIGNEQELVELGIWDHPLVLQHRDEIRKGQLVVEALRSGVEMNSLQHFLNIDCMGVLRQPEMGSKERARIVLQALRQVGKPYDFNFDVESNDRVYCSKLVYLCYTDINWPTKKNLGRTTFTPDDVAVEAVDGGPLRLVAFYHDGQRVTIEPLTEMARLMGVPKSSVGNRSLDP